MTTCTPTATLFPYTTLFRSPGRPVYQFTRAIGGNRQRRRVCAGRGVLLRLRHVLQRALAEGLRRPVAYLQDRKSTRLNSSHMSISYAVFCLKKKIQSDRRF